MPKSKIFSDGCLLCVRRRVKCDEAKPHCQRCERYGEECPGYRDPSEFIFRDQNETAENHALKLRHARARRKRGERKSPPCGDREPGPGPAQVDIGKRAVCAANTVPSAMPNDFEMESLCYFLENFMLPGDEGRPGYLDFVPRLTARSDEAPYFNDALRAVSQAAMANRYRLEHLLPGARRLHGKALSALHVALSDPEIAVQDHVLATSLLCSKYELITGEKPDLYESHCGGQNTLVRLRGPSQFETHVGQSLFFAVTLRNHTRNLVEMSTTDPELIDVCSPALTVANAFSPAMEYFNAALPSLTRVRDLLVQSSEDTHEIVEITMKLTALSNKLEAWRHSVPEEFMPVEIANEPSAYRIGTDPYEPSYFLQILKIFRSPEHGGFWCHYWSGRIQVLRTIIICMAYCKVRNLHVFPDTDEEDAYPYHGQEELGDERDHHRYPCRIVAELSLQSCVTQLLSLVPYMLGKLMPFGPSQTHQHAAPFASFPIYERSTWGSGKALGAYFLVLTLYPAGLVCCIPRDQHDWIQERLLEIGGAVGIRQGLTLRENLRSFRETCSTKQMIEEAGYGHENGY